MLNFHEFLHTTYKYVLDSVVKIPMMFAKYFEYYTIILPLHLGGPFFRGHTVKFIYLICKFAAWRLPGGMSGG